MTKQQAGKRIEKLKKVISHHRYLHHVLDRQEISESALDSLKKELFDLEQLYPDLITPDSPTQRIAGKALDKFEKVQHSQPMLSFNDAFSEQDMYDWEERIKKLLSEQGVKKLNYFAEPKIDGLAVCLIYNKGVFYQGATRGDGKIGENVTQNLRTIESIPLRLQKDITCEVRGEVYITKKDFEKLNQARIKAGEEPYANPRNTAAGAIRQLNPKITALRRLSFLAWQLLGRATQVEEQKELSALGFKSVGGNFCPDLSAVFVYHQELQKNRDKFLFQIDGIVVSVNNNELFEKLGVVGKAPRGSIAFKFPLKQAVTIIKDIDVQIGRTGAITPVAILKPVQVGGVVITRATLHNEDEIKRLGVKIEDTVIVGRAGDVIPRVVKVLKALRDGKEKTFSMPRNCPICGTNLIKPRGEAVLRCPNSLCQVRRKRQLAHFVSKAAFDIEGLGPKIIAQLLEQGLIQDASDIFALKQGDLIPLERFAEKSAQNLVEAIAERKKITLARFIFALGIRGVGEETARTLSGIFNFQFSIFKPKVFYKKFLALSLEDFQQIKDIGPVVGKSIYNWFHNKRNIAFLKRLDKTGIEITMEGAKLLPHSKLEGKVFVLTGGLESLTRAQAKEKIRALGGDVSSAVSRKTDFVVVGSDPGSKLAKAKKLGIKTLAEKEFLSLLKEK